MAGGWMIKVSALYLRDKERLREREIERAWQYGNENVFVLCTLCIKMKSSSEYFVILSNVFVFTHICF